MKKLNILIVILLIISLWMNFTINERVEQLRTKITSINHSLSSQINSISSNVNSAANAMKKQALWVRESSYEVIRVNEKFSQFDVEFTFTLNKKNNDEKLYIICTSEEDGKQEKIEVPESEVLNYKVKLVLEDENYTFDLLGISESTSRSEKLDNIYLKNIKNSIIHADGEILKETCPRNNDNAFIDFYVSVSAIPQKSLRGMENLIGKIEFKEITADVYMGLEYINTIDLMNVKGYTYKDIAKISNSCPEFRNDVNVKMFSGTYEIDGNKYLEKKDQINAGKYEENEIFFVIKIVDTKGNEYKQIIMTHGFHYLNGDEVKRIN